MILKDKFKKCLKRLRSKNENIEFKFLEERPFAGDKTNNKLQFGHEKIVSTLKDIVLRSPQSFTIGLYGDWGTGKSTIITSLRKELYESEVPLILFDVWKHEGDALRRTFLNTVVNDLKKKYDSNYLKKGFKIDDRNHASKIESEEFVKILWKKALTHFSVIAILTVFIIFPFLVFWLVMKKFLNWDITESWNGSLLGGVFSVALLPIFYKYINQFIQVKKVTKSQDRFKDPYEFETEFKRILKEGFLKQKLVIAFDNLDRVSGEKAIEIISTIKTFLDPIDEEVTDRDIVFIIPCDERAIKRHLQKTLHYSADFKGQQYHQYAGEYLRKFFNTIVWIPDFYTNELENYATRKLKATKIKDFENDELSALIVWVFDENPRQIIQFINVLISNYLLIKKRTIEGFNLTEDIAQLAKFLLLIQKFPDIMEVYRKTLSYNLSELPAELNDSYNNVRKFSEKRINEFYDFLNKTEHVKIESLDVFFKLRRSSFEAELGNSVKLMRLLETSRIIDVINFTESKEEDSTKADKNLHEDNSFIKNLNLKGKEDALSEIIKERLRDSKNPILLAKFINGILHLTHYKDISLDRKVYRMIYNKLKEHGTYVSEINPKLLIEECYNKMNGNIEKMGIRDIMNLRHREDFIYAHNENK
ncbi:P-loop NTPase fold protein [Winogradskyella sp. MIT101101]|uniref:P-loop NTPase fold protein n=1 Tax=Winogradskyella sp. MIT101101 TaxID=3098297 RepID=UPI0039997E0E